MRRLRHAPLFTVALTHGVTFGWGTEFLLTADYCIATPTARFALPETGLGIVPGARGTAELALQVGPAQALRLGCTGKSTPTPRGKSASSTSSSPTSTPASPASSSWRSA